MAEAATVDISTAARIDNDFVPAIGVNTIQVSMSHQRSIWLTAQEHSSTRRDDEQASIWQPIHANRLKRRKLQTNHHFALAFEIDRNDFLSTPVGDPQTSVVPAW